MTLTITKSARQFGYVIWSNKTDAAIKKLVGERNTITVYFNGFVIGEKVIDWKYHRISIGYKFTRALPETAKVYRLTVRNDILEVEATNV